MGRQYERPWLKGQMSTLTFETLDWTYQVRIITLASTVLKNQLFKKFPIQMHKEANLTLTLSRSRSSWDHHLNKLGRPHIPNATYQVSRSLAFWFWRRRFLKGFYYIWEWRPSLSCDQNILYKFWLTYHKESSHEIWVQLGQWFVRKLCFNILMGPQYERPWLKGQRSTLTFETYL